MTWWVEQRDARRPLRGLGMTWWVVQRDARRPLRGLGMTWRVEQRDARRPLRGLGMTWWVVQRDARRPLRGLGKPWKAIGILLMILAGCSEDGTMPESRSRSPRADRDVATGSRDSGKDRVSRKPGRKASALETADRSKKRPPAAVDKDPDAEGSVAPVTPPVPTEVEFLETTWSFRESKVRIVTRWNGPDDTYVLAVGASEEAPACEGDDVARGRDGEFEAESMTETAGSYRISVCDTRGEELEHTVVVLTFPCVDADGNPVLDPTANGCPVGSSPLRWSPVYPILTSQANAVNYCQNYGNGGWRLPAKAELVAIRDTFTQTWPDTPTAFRTYYWSTEPYKSPFGNFFIGVNMGQGARCPSGPHAGGPSCPLTPSQGAGVVCVKS